MRVLGGAVATVIGAPHGLRQQALAVAHRRLHCAMMQLALSPADGEQHCMAALGSCLRKVSDLMSVLQPRNAG